MFNPAVFIG